MKNIKYLLIIITTVILSWAMPYSYHLIYDVAPSNVFTYYSSVDHAFCKINFDEKEERLIRMNVNTKKEYTQMEFDSILPLFFCRQLLADGRMPETIDGYAITPDVINEKTFNYNYSPKDKNRPHIPLYTLFESISGRVRLEMPGDMFRITDKIEFLRPSSKDVDRTKSDKFQKALEAKGFCFPATQLAGNPNPRKPYEEGYLILDQQNQLFHLKMVNGKPFVKQITIPDGLSPQFIETQEPADRSFYAFVFGSDGEVFTLTTDNYSFQRLPIPPFDLETNQLSIMANPLYWNVSVISRKGRENWAISTQDYSIVDKYIEKSAPNKAHFTQYVFPFSVDFTSPYSSFIRPVIYFGSYWVALGNIALALLMLFIFRGRKKENVLWTLLTGIYGFIATLLFNRVD
ncbi:DUF4857 domain-containing protein [Halosquirtibacter xylanolyticus]|uniref:DUF4857 domain-containing protein n=1 Tax=Halosquirtibacter xylanolyticus TaxID=3374599 RepID=UPI003749CE20|nr:DUF4857 domain-containing protein [Prolixibacteraceae bacterium]